MKEKSNDVCINRILRLLEGRTTLDNLMVLKTIEIIIMTNRISESIMPKMESVFNAFIDTVKK